ncbi:Asp23/Gls24 family envelope stress response protein [Alicyclobacillus tolerans]|uniref:Asp23/Gls24 family envelope stress response protein n=1 Tax=Alicyclobacillus tolerans TaxID=90970 RepID=UPI001F295354|nr:Asp23/Gls24 family envelope stress response protein [Alicyclobacillus tolerans]MCF8563593.1 Asp23/Gls24 family envelope stress response protein [Alicyclobacillus tolerans]
MQDMEFQSTELGKIQIADEVIQIIAGLAASEIEGVADMTGTFAGGITESILGRRNFSKGVRVQFGEEDKTCLIDLSVVLDFGVKIPEVCMMVQEHVKQAVESMTGLEVVTVNIHVTAVALQSEKGKEIVELPSEKRTR